MSIIYLKIRSLILWCWAWYWRS